MIYIENFQEGQHIIGHYLCKDKQAMKTRAGKTYYNVLLMDKTGTAMGKIWDMTPQIGDFNKQEFIKIDANVTVFQAYSAEYQPGCAEVMKGSTIPQTTCR